MNQSTLTGKWDDYVSALREDAHLLLAWSYADARPNLRAARDEYDLTGMLADAMEARINNPLTPERFSLYSVHNERPISPTAELGKDRPKLDIQIERCGIRPKIGYTFEAKRLRDDQKANPSSCVAHYLGDDGVGRFVTGKYEKGNSEAAMLGCFQAHKAEFWINRIARAFADDVIEKGRFNIVKAFQSCTIVQELPYEGSTLHRRANGATIRLFHIFLDCA